MPSGCLTHLVVPVVTSRHQSSAGTSLRHGRWSDTPLDHDLSKTNSSTRHDLRCAPHPMELEPIEGGHDLGSVACGRTNTERVATRLLAGAPPATPVRPLPVLPRGLPPVSAPGHEQRSPSVGPSAVGEGPLQLLLGHAQLPKR